MTEVDLSLLGKQVERALGEQRLTRDKLRTFADILRDVLGTVDGINERVKRLEGGQ